jgi:hypothetical protein
MKTSKTNLIVYIKQPVHREQTRTITDSIGSLHGVVNAKSSPRAQSMISAGYDPRIVHSQHILQCASNQGVDARLVGM